MAIRTVPPTGNYNAPGTSTGRRERSFAALYEQARRAAANDDAGQDTQNDTNSQVVDDQNIKRIDTLRDQANTLRGEIIVRVIQSGSSEGDDALKATGDISRLSTRLDTLRKKLQTEEIRLSGKLVDVKV